VRAVVVNGYGEEPVVAEVPRPRSGPRQLLIKLAAAGMNPMGRTLATGDWRPMPARFPMVLGADGAGVIDTVDERAFCFSPFSANCLSPRLGRPGPMRNMWPSPKVPRWPWYRTGWTWRWRRRCQRRV
jgi:NADPH:quinone reductase-like Zn-dependent oxidoreductase